MGISSCLARRLAVPLLCAGLLAGCTTPRDASVAPAVVASASAEARAALAPTGVLRIAVYAGSPTSLVREVGSDDARGLSVDIGRELASRLGVPSQLLEFERVEQVMEALRSGRADMTVTNATAARAALVDFTEPLVALELGYLALPDAPLTSIGEVDREGIRVGVSQGSSSQAVLRTRYRHASLVAVPSLKAAAEMLADHSIDVFATNKGILFQLADGLPGARVLDGRWGTESLAIGVPQGRARGRPYLEDFALSVRQGGLVQRAAARAGLRGLAEAQAR